MKKFLLVLLAMVFLGGCEENTKTQYLAVKDKKILYPYGKISYSVQHPSVVAKVISYQKQYTGPDSIHPGHMLFKFIAFDPELVRLKDCIVYDVDNWEGTYILR
jgi:hypothetical protein